MKVSNNTYSPSFGYKNILKTEWLKGRLPTVKRGFYGDILTKENISLEHLQCHSKGGKSTLSNFVLASKRMNQARGCKDLKEFANPETVLLYLKEFIGVKTKNFDGDEYIAMIKKKLKSLGFKLYD